MDRKPNPAAEKILARGVVLILAVFPLMLTAKISKRKTATGMQAEDLTVFTVPLVASGIF